MPPRTRRTKKSNEQKAAEFLRDMGLDLKTVGIEDDSMLVSREINEQRQRSLHGVQMMLDKPKSLMAKKCLYCAREFLTNYKFEGCCCVEHSIALYEKRYNLKWNLKKRMWQDYEPPVSITPEHLSQLESWARHFLADLERLRAESQTRLPILLEELQEQDETGHVPFVSLADNEVPEYSHHPPEEEVSPALTSPPEPPLILDLDLDFA